MTKVEQINYKNYIQDLQDNAPPSETAGKVKKEVDYFQKEAFKEKPTQPSHAEPHGKDQCLRANRSLQFWQKREQDAKA